MRGSFLWAGFAFVAATSGALIANGCSSSADATSTAAGGASATSSSTSSNGEGAGDPFDAGNNSDAPSNYGCSGDLRDVVDQNGDLVMTCPPDQGCSMGACIPACAAAAASSSNVGCDFLVPTALTWGEDLPPCFAVFVANTWPKAVKIQVERGGQKLDVTKFGRVPVNGMPPAQWPAVDANGLAQDQVAVLFLSSDPNSIMIETGGKLSCPITPAIDASTALANSGIGEAFHITSDAPLGAYDIAPFGGAASYYPSAELLFPTNAWGLNFVAIATPVGTHDMPGPLWGQIVAQKDQTQIQILPPVDLPAGNGFPKAPKGVVTTFMLDAGKYLQWQLPGANKVDLSGTVVLSDKPIAMFTGNRFFRDQTMPAPGGESTHQELMPVTSLASEYVGAPYATRRKDLMPEPIQYRLVGAADGTQLVFDPPVAGAPATMDRGQIVDIVTPDAFIVSSQDDMHPFAFAQIMSSANVPGGSRPGATASKFGKVLGDEEFVIGLPPAQFLSKYVFFTDPSYATTNLVITRVKKGGAFDDVSVDCLGVVGGWQPVGASGKYEVTNVDLVRADIGVAQCANGHQRATSKSPFGVVVWGLDSYSSYAYPAGGNAAKLSGTVVVPK
jgi:hypothetical protein